MSEGNEEFTPVDGDHYVMVPAGNTDHAELIGLRGRIVAIGTEGLLQVEFDGYEATTVISASNLVEYDPNTIPRDSTPVVDAASGPRIGIYFGTETGNTQDAAEKIRDRLAGCNVTAWKDISECSVTELLDHDVLILGISTWNIGDIQYDWEVKLDEIGAQDYSGIKVAMFGLGDAAGYPDTFVDGLGILWNRMKDNGAELVGIWPTEGYEYDESQGQYDDNHFLGVVLDDDGEPELTDGRIEQWVEQLRRELNLPAAVVSAA